jgi:hypothetical protein
MPSVVSEAQLTANRANPDISRVTLSKEPTGGQQVDVRSWSKKWRRKT